MNGKKFRHCIYFININAFDKMPEEKILATDINNGIVLIALFTKILLPTN
jgi:hypothetical protein